MEADMRRSIALAAILACAFVSSASAQSNVPNNMGAAPWQQVAPLAPPPQPTPSPLPPRSSNSIQAPRLQPPVDTFSDKTARCLHYGATQGLTGGDLSAYSRACANN
jgi:hypothetical protein